MTPVEQASMLEHRQARRHPWHKPPHEGGEVNSYHLFAACYEHKPLIGHTPERIAEFESDLMETLRPLSLEIFAWAVMPNHYHCLLRTGNVLAITTAIGRLHGRNSFLWNKEEACQGRQVWSGCMERRIRTARHFWATMNYVHNNPVRHQYVRHWQDWPFSSAATYLENIGRDEAARIWSEYPLLDYGKGWDDL